jgi:thiol:disulfide interchange protein DsbC
MKLSAITSVAVGLLLTIAAPLQAAEPAADEDMTRLLKQRLGSDQIAPPTETEIDGVYMTRFGNRIGYLLEGGRYIFIGDLVDLEQGRNLTELSRRDTIVEELAAFPRDKRVIFPAVDEEKAVLSVFTDTSCGYCQQLHREVEFLQQAGISVHYIPFPRGGNRGPGYHHLKQVWCSEDPLEAMSIAKGAEDGELTSNETCDEAQYVDEGYLLGNRIGVTGTPSLFTSEGASFNGYVPYQKLIPQLLTSQ